MRPKSVSVGGGEDTRNGQNRMRLFFVTQKDIMHVVPLFVKMYMFGVLVRVYSVTF